MVEYAKEKYIKLSLGELDKLLGHGDGNAALLYLYWRRCGSFSLGRAARALKCTEAELLAAAGTLRGLGLLSEPERMLEREAPEYTAEDVAVRAGTDAAFEAAVTEAEAVLGRVLGANDLKLLFGIYDYWGLPADVILLLLHHCVERYQQRYGPGRKPTMRYVEKEAQRWAGQEVNTLDAAEDYIRRDREKRAQMGRIKDILQLRGRELTATEAKYIESWLALGFSPEAVALAYDRTMIGAGRLAWSYMDRILHTWQEKGLYTPTEIEAGDPRRGPGAPPHTEAPAEGKNYGDKLETMRRMYSRMTEKKDGA